MARVIITVREAEDLMEYGNNFSVPSSFKSPMKTCFLKEDRTNRINLQIVKDSIRIKGCEEFIFYKEKSLEEKVAEDIVFYSDLGGHS